MKRSTYSGNGPGIGTLAGLIGHGRSFPNPECPATGIGAGVPIAGAIHVQRAARALAVQRAARALGRPL